MLYIAINAERERVSWIDIPEPNPYKATAAAWIEGRCDTGQLGAALPDRPGLSILVYEFGLLEPKWTEFFVLAKELYVGNALLYAYDVEGETVDCEDWQFDLVQNNIIYLHSRSAVEEAIRKGLVNRPQTSVTAIAADGTQHEDVLWNWKG